MSGFEIRPGVWIAPARPEDAAALVPSLRAADRAEIEALGGDDPEVVLARAVAASDRAWRVAIHGRAAALFGVADHRPMPDGADGVGSPWLMTTDAVAAHPRPFLKAAPACLDLMSQGYRRLVNHVDVRNRGAVAWLVRLGFVLDPPAPFGPRGFLFHRFEKECS